MLIRIATTAATIIALTVSLAAAESINLVGGSTSVITVINPVKAAFEKSTGIELKATAVGSKVALQKLDAGEADAATAAHSFDELMEVVKKDKVELKNPVDKLKVSHLAPATSYSIIVNRSNPVNALTKEQLAGIFSGTITNWKEVGGNDAPIICVLGNMNPGSNDLFSKTYLDGKKITVETLDVSTVNDLRQNVSSNPEAIAFIVASMVDGTVKAVEAPVMKSKPIILLTVGSPAPKVQKLIDFIKTDGSKYIK
ncbi:substrate-binding domain-containing protein [Geobacter sp. DSM 9736]|uniref:substrate-binding domain-containing protein n=1 Tax=Geobacter sp. DSM 9736 TaxID=1277350 RepID=UPI000B502065|nr:substrate-binding domain-containing protein [Geobacter sp. DSM 9736]SNB46831.1 phosphate ABC transporter substrate-binding protein, PhoT family [Geobacter sp. DSM 9736]